jgi:hypothetical protein
VKPKSNSLTATAIRIIESRANLNQMKVCMQLKYYRHRRFYEIFCTSHNDIKIYTRVPFMTNQRNNTNNLTSFQEPCDNETYCHYLTCLIIQLSLCEINTKCFESKFLGLQLALKRITIKRLTTRDAVFF